MTEMIEDYHGMSNNGLALFLYAERTNGKMPREMQEILAHKKIVEHLEGKHSLPPEQMAKQQMRHVKQCRKLCRDAQGKLNALPYLSYCKQRDIALPLAVRYIPEFNLDKFKQKDGELLHCAVVWISENQAKVRELNAAIFSGPEGIYDATALHQYRRLHKLVLQMYKVTPMKREKSL